MDSVQSLGQQNFNQKITGLLQKYPVVLQLCRFGAIGFLNTGLNFLIVNAISKSLGINSGLSLGYISAISFAIVTAQSYYWNRNWAFDSSQGAGLLTNFIRLAMVGFMGVLAVGLSILGSKVMAQAVFYSILIVIFFVIEFVFWKIFKLGSEGAQQDKNPVLLFLIVSLVGLLINATIVSLVSSNLVITQNLDLNKNIAIVIATAISLVWNFLGYKIFVFKK